MICPKCEYEYVEGIEVCADCGATLIPVEEFEGNLLNPSDWLVVTAVAEQYEAEMLKANLESAGIETLLYSKQDRNFPASGSWTLIKVLVKKRDSEDALVIINDIRSGKHDEPPGDNTDEVQ